MDWFPNVDGVLYFVRTILPLIRRRCPECTMAIVERRPPPEICKLSRDSRIRVTGTVSDMRPHLWASAVAIVPLRIGEGTRLKIYEAMAARVPVVSTTVGAEGLTLNPPHDIHIADLPEDFAERCLELIGSSTERARVSCAAWELVNSRFSWEQYRAASRRLWNWVRASGTSCKCCVLLRGRGEWVPIFPEDCCNARNATGRRSGSVSDREFPGGRWHG
jgi:glycosyltransferase involved in cell wall biosynthesis